MKRIILVVFVLGFFSCGEYEVLEVEKRSKRTADSLFKAHKDSLTTVFNAQCDTNKERYYNTALDSLKKTRITDIKNLIEK